MRKRLVLRLLVRGKSVATSFNGAPVLSSGDGDCIHAVHDSLVVCGSTEGVKLCELVAFNNALRHLFA